MLGKAISCLPEIINLDPEPRQVDLDEEASIASFMATTCGCHGRQAYGPCSAWFTSTYVLSVRASCSELSHSELDLAVMGQLLAGMATTSTARTTHHSTQLRQRSSCTYMHNGNQICEKMFRILLGIGCTRLKNLKKNVCTHGLSLRVHGNTRRTPSNVTSLSSVEFFVLFLLNFSEQNGLLLPGRIPGYSRSDLKLLPSSVSKRAVWRVYATASNEAESIQSVSYPTFCRLWRSLLPSIIIMKPMTDLCWQCQQNSSAILRSANMSESDKSDTLRKAEEHLRIVQLERSTYTSSCEECRRSIHTHFMHNSEFVPPPLSCCIPPNTVDIKAYYSFDYAQQVRPELNENIMR